MILEISPPTFISEGTRVQGSLTFFANTQIFGVVEGELLQQSLEAIQIGRGGWINGSITSQGPVIIEGRVEGSVSSTTKIRLMPTATVNGTLAAPQIEILAGAIFEGELRMPTPQGKKEPLKRAA